MERSYEDFLQAIKTMDRPPANQEPHLIKRIDEDLRELGGFDEVLRIRTETEVVCGVAYCFVGTEIVNHLGGPKLPSYQEEFGWPRFDGRQAPTGEDMTKLENSLREAGLLP